MSVHATCMWISTGLLLPVSVLVVARPSLRVHRATVHAAMQMAFVVVFYVGIAAARDDSDSRAPCNGAHAPTRFHRGLGAALAYGAVPVALVAASTSFRHHRLVARLVVVGLAVQLASVAGRGSAVLFPAVLFLYATLFLYWSFRLGRYARPETARERLLRAASVTTSVSMEGSGWSWYMTRHPFDPRVRTVSTRAHRGIAAGPETNGMWFKSGTTVGEVQATLAAHGLTLPGTPSLNAATLGGWIFTGSHGSGGTLWTPAFGRLVMYDRQLRCIRTVGHKSECFSDDRSVEEQRRYVVLEVEVRPVPNVRCTRVARDIDTLDGARFFLHTPSHLRLLFVDSHAALSFVWTPWQGEDSKATRRPWRWWWVPPPWLASLLPAAWSSRVPRDAWHATTTLRRANRFAIDPPFATAAFVWLYVNVEVFVRLPAGATVTPQLLLRCCHALRHLFRFGGTRGRCEIRAGATKLFLDFALTSRDYDRVAACVRAMLAPLRCTYTLHKGKAQVPVV